MLILTRRIGEKLIIDGDIEVMILGVKGNQVRVGINAPQQVSVNREEIQLKIDQELAGFKPSTTIIHKPRRAALQAVR